MRTRSSLILYSGVILATLLLFNPVASSQSAEAVEGAEEEKVIGTGAIVGFDYTLLDDQGKQLETSKGKKPLSYIHGKSQIIPGLEKAMEGMQVGEEKTVQVKPEEAYGVAKPELFREIPKSNLPPGDLKVGARLLAQSAQGQRHPVRVHEIKEETVVIDFNHPMAGKTLVFEVKILTIEAVQKKAEKKD